MKKGIIIAIVVIISGLMLWKLFSNKKKLDDAKQVPTEQTDIAIPINAITIGLAPINNALTKTGTLIPNKEADIPALTGGKIVSVNFSLGSIVSQGAVVAQVDSRSMELNLAQAKLAKNKAEQDYRKFEKLLAGEATTESTFQDVKLNFENTQNQIALLEKQIADTRIKAPISGQIISKTIEPGEFVGMGQSVAKMVDLSRLKVKVMVSESEVYQLKINQPVQIKTDVYPNILFDGKITFISGQGDATFNYEIEITLENNKKDAPLKAGSYAYVDFKQNTQIEGIQIPRSALVESIQNPYVYVIKNNLLEKRSVVIERDLGNVLLIKSGLSAGEQVVTSGLVNVREGSKVQIVNTNLATKTAQ